MAEDQENQTEKPTEKRLSEAHERGQFAKAPEFQVIAGLLAACMVMIATMKDQATHIAAFSAGLFGHLNSYEVRPEGIAQWTMLSVVFVLKLMLPMLVA